MPSHKIHRMISKLVLGKDYRKLHKYLDMPFLVFGKRHRILFHDLLTVAMLQKVDPKLGAAAALHILLDSLERKGRMRKRWLKRALVGKL